MPVTPRSLDLDEAVRQWVAIGSDLNFDSHVIDANQKRNPSPKELYATVLEVAESPDGTSIYRQLQNNSQRIQQSITTTFSLQWFRTGARDVARHFQLWCHSFQGIEAAELRGLTLYRTGELRRLDAVDDFDWEERAGIDVMLGFVAQFAPTVSSIGSVDVEVCLD